MATQLPLGIQVGQSAPSCMQSPPYTPYETSLASHIQPWQSNKQHYSSTSSSLGPHGSPTREMSPPYSANSTSSVVYNYPTPSASPGSASLPGNQSFSPGSSAELMPGCQYMGQQPSPPTPYSDMVFSPYPASTAQSFGQPASGFSASTFEFQRVAAPGPYPAPVHQHHRVMHTQAKLEPRMEAMGAVAHLPLVPQGQGYVHQAKTRYTKVAVAGAGGHASEPRHHHQQQHQLPVDPIKGISEWLQESPAAVY